MAFTRNGLAGQTKENWSYVCPNFVPYSFREGPKMVGEP